MVKIPAERKIGEPEKPAGLRPRAQLDSRFPITYESSVPEAMRLITEYFAALSRRDLEGMARTLHFPFATYEGTEPTVIESEKDLLANPPPSMNVTGKRATRIKPGAYDMLDSLELHTYHPVSVALSLCYSRYSTDGHKLLVCQGIYAITNNDGKWGIELSSTIFTPADYVGVTYNDATEAALRRSRDWMLGYSLRDQSVLNSTHQLGRRAGLAPPDPRSLAHNARGGNPMDQYRSKGVKSRLRVSEATPESIARMDANFPEFAEWAGGGVGQWAYTLSLPGARVLHATVDKAHVHGGYIRYTAEATVISESHALSIMTYKKGRWGSSGGFGIMMHHDHTNDIRA